MIEPVLHSLVPLAHQWSWAPIAAATAIVARDLVRLLVFVWGLVIVSRGTSGSDRAQVLTAYASCISAEPVPLWRPEVSRRRVREDTRAEQAQ
jgi:hypothetical protein